MPFIFSNVIDLCFVILRGCIFSPTACHKVTLTLNESRGEVLLLLDQQAVFTLITYRAVATLYLAW